MTRFLSTLVAAAMSLAVPLTADAVTAQFDFGTDAGPIQAGFAGVTPGGGFVGVSGAVAVQAVPVGVTLDTRDRVAGNGGGAEQAMWQDFVFGNGSNAVGEGIDLNVFGLAPDTTYPVRIWGFDDSTNGGRSTLWNGNQLNFLSTPDAASLGDHMVSFNVTTDAIGNALIEGRVGVNNGGTHHVFINGLEIGDAVVGTPLPIKETYRIDVDTTVGAAIATADGFTSLDATGGNGSSVVADGVTFTVFSADGGRNRAEGGITAPNNVTGDFIFDDGANGASGLTVNSLPAGIYRAKVYSHDDSFVVGNQIVGITRFGALPELIYTDSFAANSSEPFAFVFSTDYVPDGAGFFTRENNDTNRSRFNALELERLHIAPGETQFQIDIDSTTGGAIRTAPGFTSLDATGGNGSSVTVDGVTFEVFSADGSRNRAGGADDVTADFVFDEGGENSAVGVTVTGLPDGIWQASVFAFDDLVDAGDQIVGINRAGLPELIFTDSFAANETDPFTFVFDSTLLPDTFGIFTRENNAGLRSRFNGLQLVLLEDAGVPEPGTALLGLLALGGLAMRGRRGRHA